MSEGHVMICVAEAWRLRCVSRVALYMCLCDVGGISAVQCVHYVCVHVRTYIHIYTHTSITSCSSFVPDNLKLLCGSSGALSRAGCGVRATLPPPHSINPPRAHPPVHCSGAPRTSFSCHWHTRASGPHYPLFAKPCYVSQLLGSTRAGINTLGSPLRSSSSREFCGRAHQ